jgi:putative restriction endonuclease
VAIEAAHIRWHSQQGPDEVANALALCTLHHALLDLGVLGLSVDLRVLVSPLYVARSAAGQAVHALDGTALRPPQPGQPTPAAAHVGWHGRLVFKGKVTAA